MISKITDLSRTITFTWVHSKMIKSVTPTAPYFSTLAFTFEQLSQMYHIISGDPSRGTIALESHAAPIEGTKIQARFFDSHFNPATYSWSKMYYRPKSACAEIPTRYTQPQPNRRTLAFMASPSDMPPEIAQLREGGDDAIHLLPDTFLAASENGFSLSRSQNGVAEGAWRCTVAGGLAGLEWP